MGQTAEDMLDGSMCSGCGCYFEHPEGGIYVHEHPVLCRDCWQPGSSYPIAEVDTF